MAKLDFEDRIAHPLEACFLGMRDHMAELAPYLHGVKEIIVHEKKEVAPGKIYIVNEWVSDYRVPAVVAKVLKPEMLRWLDVVTWDHTTYSWHWKFESKLMKNALEAEGTNRMVADGPGATRFLISGDLNIHVDRIPGVPGFLGRAVRPQVEKFIVSLVEPRMRGIDQGLARWLDERAKKTASA